MSESAPTKDRPKRDQQNELQQDERGAAIRCMPSGNVDAVHKCRSSSREGRNRTGAGEDEILDRHVEIRVGAVLVPEPVGEHGRVQQLGLGPAGLFDCGLGGAQ